MSNITTKPLKPSAVDMNIIKYSKVNSLSNGAKTLYLNHGDGISSLFVQSPEMVVPFDSGTYWPGDDGSGKYQIQVAMDNLESNPKMKEFHDMLVKMDEQILQDGISNSLAWFKKKNPNEDVIRELYTPMVKVSIDPETGEPSGKWASKFQFKIVKRNDKILCDVYDSDKNKLETSGEGSVDLEQMFKKGTKVKMILKCNGLWIASGKFGCTWRAEQIKVDAPAGFSGYAFEDSDDEDSGVELSRQHSKAVSSKDVDTEEVEPKADNYVEDDESGSESEGESDDGAGVEPKSVKRMVKKA